MVPKILAAVGSLPGTSKIAARHERFTRRARRSNRWVAGSITPAPGSGMNRMLLKDDCMAGQTAGNSACFYLDVGFASKLHAEA